MLIASLPITSQIKIKPINADAIEFRLDFLTPFDIDFIKQLRNQCTQPVIFTLRKQTQGGLCTDNESIRQQKILQLCQLQPDYIDLEYDTDHAVVDEIKQTFPAVKLICSYHDFRATPDDLTCILQQMHYSTYDFYKLATFANSTHDALRMLLFAKSTPANVTGMCMGKLGSITRLLSPIVSNAFTYASVDKQPTAPGQASLDELLTLYHYQQLNPETDIYALLGDPIDQSVGHILHNHAMRILNRNAIYVKMAVKPHELATLIDDCQRLPFKGFSITMPLKECITHLLDEPRTTDSAINTVIYKNQRFYGFNTDGIGALKALQPYLDLRNQTIVILGAGGASQAIAQALTDAGAKLIIFNRTLKHAEGLANRHAGHAYPLQQLHKLNTFDYSVIINTIPRPVIDSALFKPGTFVMDIVYQPIITPFLEQAKQAGCIAIPGYLMYIEQALLQLQHWFEPTSAQCQRIRQMMETYFLSCIKN